MIRTLGSLAKPDRDIVGDRGVVLTGATHDSRSVAPGYLFCCVPGDAFDGHDFAQAAIDAGAAALLVDHPLDMGVPELRVVDVRASMGYIAAEIYDNPTAHLDVVGVTGTNGKTTITQILAAILEQAGRSAATIGTLSGARTTPEAPELQARLAALRADGADAVIMEVSSHALDLHRVDGCEFAVAIFTNLGRDHLDFHHTQEAYFAAKAKLFVPSLARTAVINLDDPRGRQLAEQTTLDVTGYRLADALDVRHEGEITRFVWRGVEVAFGLAGSHNVSNALAALSAAVLLGLTPAQAAAGLAAVRPPSGRFEFVPSAADFSVVVDYAHTPDALLAALEAAREVAGENQVILVFGCGGDRDKQKRPEMGAVAAANADVAIVTSDNPRSEDPNQIIASIVAGAIAGPAPTIQPDRRAAIAHAISLATTGDIVLIAGKGHETQQVVGTTVLPFDDRLVARDALTALGLGPGGTTP